MGPVAWAGSRVDTLTQLLRACGADLELAPRLGEGIDRTAIHQLLGLTPRERVERAAADAAGIATLERAARV